MTDDLGPVPDRLDVDAGLVTRLIAAQFPRWAGLAVRPVPTPGWDNRSFRLGADMLVRLPSAAAYAEAVDKEQRWLPVLAPQLPLPIPRPLALGGPACDLAIAWTLLSGASRSVFRDRLGVDDGMWARGRGWALWKAVADGDRRVVEEIVAQ